MSLAPRRRTRIESDREDGMADRGWVHTVYRDGKWVNEIEGAQRASSSHPTKDQAVQRGRELAKNKKTEHVIHNKDGKIPKGGGGRQTYGPDSRKTKG
jgi:hypothetical protein